jgi:hypothetical protein
MEAPLCYKPLDLISLERGRLLVSDHVIPPADRSELTSDLSIQESIRQELEEIHIFICDGNELELLTSLGALIQGLDSINPASEDLSVCGLDEPVVVSDLLSLIHESSPMEILRRALAAIRLLFWRSEASFRFFLEEGGLPLILQRIRFTEDLHVLQNCLEIVKRCMFPETMHRLTEDLSWVQEYLRLRTEATSPCQTHLFASFLPHLFKLFPLEAKKICKIAARLLRDHCDKKDEGSVLIQVDAIDVFSTVTSEPSCLQAFVESEGLKLLFQLLSRLPEKLQSTSMKIVRNCYSLEGNAGSPTLLGKALVHLRFEPFFAGIESGCLRLKRRSLRALQSIFEQFGDLISFAIEKDLPNLLKSVLGDGSFEVRVWVLELIQTMIQYAAGDFDREPFLDVEFVQVLLDSLDSDHASLHNRAFETLFALHRTAVDGHPIHDVMRLLQSEWMETSINA